MSDENPSRGFSAVPSKLRAGNAGSGDAADNTHVGRVTSPGDGVNITPSPAGSGDPAYNPAPDVGRVPSPGVLAPDEPPPRRLRRLHRVWPDRDGNISYLLTPCVDGRVHVLDNEATFQRLVAFLLDSPSRYRWFARRFVVMPDHLHLIAHQGPEAVRLGQWMKALKAVVGGLERRNDGAERRADDRRVGEPGLHGVAERTIGTSERPVGAPGLQNAGRVPPPGADAVPSPGANVATPPGAGALTSGATPNEFTRIKRSWRWQEGFHDHKLRTPESEQRKWDYVCLNPVRYGLVARPEQWPFGGEIFYDEAGGPRLIRGTPPLLETGLLIKEEPTSTQDRTPGEGTRPAR